MGERCCQNAVQSWPRKYVCKGVIIVLLLSQHPCHPFRKDSPQNKTNRPDMKWKCQICACDAHHGNDPTKSSADKLLSPKTQQNNASVQDLLRSPPLKSTLESQRHDPVNSSSRLSFRATVCFSTATWTLAGWVTFVSHVII